MIEVDRYGQRSECLIKTDTHAHSWDPLDTKYIDFSENFDVENKHATSARTSSAHIIA